MIHKILKFKNWEQHFPTANVLIYQLAVVFVQTGVPPPCVGAVRGLFFYRTTLKSSLHTQDPGLLLTRTSSWSPRETASKAETIDAEHESRRTKAEGKKKPVCVSRWDHPGVQNSSTPTLTFLCFIWRSRGMRTIPDSWTDTRRREHTCWRKRLTSTLLGLPLLPVHKWLVLNAH